MDEVKQTIRQEMRRRRRALAPAVVDAAAIAVTRVVGALDAFRRARVVLAYAATDNEMPAGAVMEAAFAAGKRVFLPRLAGGRMMFAEHRPGVPLTPGPFGIPEATGAPLADCDMVAALALVPVVAWDLSGARVGRGGGHYDRAFGGPARPECLVGLAYAFQQCTALPREPWDLRLDCVATGDGLVHCWRGDDASSPRKEGTNDNDIRMDSVAQRRAGRRPGVGGGPPPTPAR